MEDKDAEDSLPTHRTTQPQTPSLTDSAKNYPAPDTQPDSAKNYPAPDTQPDSAKNYPAPDIQPDSAKVEKACPRLRAPDKPRCPWDILG